MKKNFVHLHVHSEYSLLDGSARIKDLISKAIEYDMPALALTDHGVMYGIIEFYKTAVKSGIKPIIGCEIYQAPNSRWDKQLEKGKREEVSNHLTLLVENKTGYKNLMKLVSLGFIEGFYYKPRVDSELLAQYKDGIIALSGCISGKIPRYIQNGKISEAKKAIEEYIDIFGRDNFFLELQDSGIPEQKNINKILFDLSKEFKIPAVCTNDVHYLNKQDSKSHDVLLCIQTGTTINEAGRLKFPTSEYYFKDYNQMIELFKDFPGSVENTIEIAERCNLELALNLSLIPPFEVPESFTPDEYLASLCCAGSKVRYKEVTPEIENRINKELEVIKKMGFAEYFLIVWDLIKFAKNNDIRVGPGRGSAAGSIVSYLLNITDIEPLKYGLLFERFLNEERKNMPDIDIDFCYEKRDQVIKYVSQKYGENRVAQLITFGTMAARQAIRDAGRVLEVTYSEVDRIAKLIPMELNVTINNSMNLVPELKEIYNTNEKIREVIDTAISLEGIVRQDSIHAAGIVISAEDLYHYTPIQREGDTDIVTQYKMEDIQEIGLLKMDLLGLKTLSLIDKTLFLIKKIKDIDLDIDNINLDDKKTFEMLSTGDCLGVFQLESSGMRELVVNLKPTQFEDLVALLALYRPGPLQSGMVNDFVEAKNKQKKIKYFHPSLEPILESTYGIILYQEQIMLIASKLAGFTMSEADILRDAIGKKKKKILGSQKKKFIEGTKKVGLIDEETAEKLFELVNHFAEYGFNKSHSTAYAMISYQTAYLKTNYPVEFMAALLSIRMGSQEKVAQYVNETRRLGIKVLPPDINESFSDFTIVENSVRFGLSAIKNVGSNVIELIVKERKENGRFSSFLNFCSRVSSSVLNKKTIESLIKSGTFDSLKQPRKYLLENFENIIEEINKVKKSKESGQFSLFEEEHSSHNQEFEHFYEEYSQKKLLNFEKEM
ncbi:MAG: DNA polymerase III subunit alpha, partial [Actinobacteria bacterium]|nr:DNA polymerase III subunit alpha [Actinomycetota bacterium]